MIEKKKKKKEEDMQRPQRKRLATRVAHNSASKLRI